MGQHPPRHQQCRDHYHRAEERGSLTGFLTLLMNRVSVRMKMLTWKWTNMPRWSTKPNTIEGIIIRRMERTRAGARLGAVWFSARHFGVGGKSEDWRIGGFSLWCLFFACWEWGIGLEMWSGFYLFYNERPRYAQEMHGIIHSVTGGKWTFSLDLQLSFLLNFHISETKKGCLCLAFWSPGDGWKRDEFCLGRQFEIIWYIHTIKTNPPCST